MESLEDRRHATDGQHHIFRLLTSELGQASSESLTIAPLLLLLCWYDGLLLIQWRGGKGLGQGRDGMAQSG